MEQLIEEMIGQWENYLQEGNFPAAEKLYQQIIVKNPQEKTVHYIMGMWYRQYQQFDQAIKVFKLALVNEPDLAAEIQFEFGNTYWDMGDVAKAKEAYQKAIELDDQYMEAYYNCGQMLAQYGEKETALSLFYQALAIDESDIDTYLNIGVELSNLGKGEEAIETYQRALAIDPENYVVYSNLAAEYSEIEQYEKALACHMKALEINSFAGDVWYNLGCTYSLMGKVEKGLSALEKAVHLDEENKEYAKIDEELANLRTNGKFWKIIQ